MPLLSNDLCFKTLNDDVHADNNELATQENVNKLLSFIDLAAGASVDTNNVFHISDKLRDSTQMGKCLALMKEDPATSAMLAEREWDRILIWKNFLKCQKILSAGLMLKS
jgi:hypothetical protein